MCSAEKKIRWGLDALDQCKWRDQTLQILLPDYPDQYLLPLL